MMHTIAAFALAGVVGGVIIWWVHHELANGEVKDV